MAIAGIIASGIGFNPGSVKFIPTRGFISGLAIAPTPPSGSSGGRILHIRDKNRVFTDRPHKVHIEDIQPHIADIEVLKDELEDLETREVRMHHLLMATKGAEKAAKQLIRLERIQATITAKRAILNDEEALVLILTKLF